MKNSSGADLRKTPVATVYFNSKNDNKISFRSKGGAELKEARSYDGEKFQESSEFKIETSEEGGVLSLDIAVLAQHKEEAPSDKLPWVISHEKIIHRDNSSLVVGFTNKKDGDISTVVFVRLVRLDPD